MFILTGLSAALAKVGRAEQGEQYGLQAFEYACRQNNPILVVLAANNLGTVYSRQHRFEEAFQMYSYSWTAADQMVDEDVCTFYIISCDEVRAKINLNLSLNCMVREEFDKAWEYLHRAKQYIKPQDKETMISVKIVEAFLLSIRNGSLKEADNVLAEIENEKCDEEFEIIRFMTKALLLVSKEQYEQAHNILEDHIKPLSEKSLDPELQGQYFILTIVSDLHAFSKKRDPMYLERAKKSLDKALERSKGLISLRAILLEYYSMIETLQGNSVRALELFGEAKELAKKIPGRKTGELVTPFGAVVNSFLTSGGNVDYLIEQARKTGNAIQETTFLLTKVQLKVIEQKEEGIFELLDQAERSIEKWKSEIIDERQQDRFLETYSQVYLTRVQCYVHTQRFEDALYTMEFGKARVFMEKLARPKTIKWSLSDLKDYIVVSFAWREEINFERLDVNTPMKANQVFIYIWLILPPGTSEMEKLQIIDDADSTTI